MGKHFPISLRPFFPTIRVTHFFITSTSDLRCYCSSSCCFVLLRCLSHKNAWLNHTIPVMDNTNWRAVVPGGLEGRVSKSKTWIPEACTLDRGPGRRAAQKGGPARFSAALLCVQLTGLSFCAASRPALLCRPPARRKFMLFIWKHDPPARPACWPSV